MALRPPSSTDSNDAKLERNPHRKSADKGKKKKKTKESKYLSSPHHQTIVTHPLDNPNQIPKTTNTPSNSTETIPQQKPKSSQKKIIKYKRSAADGPTVDSGVRLKGEVGKTVAIGKKTDFSLSRLTDFGAFHETDGGFVKKQ